jgi:hypothetical protein
MAAVRRRAHRFSRRRLLTWLAGVVAVTGAAVPAGTTLVASANHSERVGVVGPTLPARPTPSTTSTTELAVAPHTDGAGGSTNGTPPSSIADALPSSDPTASATTAPPPGSPGDDTYPTGSDCSIDARGMASGTHKYCRFTATDYGGWWAGFAGTPVSDGVNDPMLTAEPNCCASDSSAAMWVTRAGTQHFYASDRSRMYGGWTGCNNNIIQPGDLVEIEIKFGNGTYNTPSSYYEAGAGLGWSCDGHP